MTKIYIPNEVELWVIDMISMMGYSTLSGIHDSSMHTYEIERTYYSISNIYEKQEE